MDLTKLVRKVTRVIISAENVMPVYMCTTTVKPPRNSPEWFEDKSYKT